MATLTSTRSRPVTLSKSAHPQRIQAFRLSSAALALMIVALLPLRLADARTLPAVPPDKAAQSIVIVELTGGDANKPIDQASVYVKFPRNPNDVNGKLIELNVKTNQEGMARAREVPQGKVLIQIIAPGWKTFGKWFDVTEPQQTIQIHLDRPSSKWY